MKILLKPTQMLGRPVTITRSKGGIELAASKKKESALFLIDEIGSEVTKYKVGDFVCPQSIMNIILRDTTFYIVDESVIFCGVGELDLDLIEIDGKPAVKTNGGQSATLQT